jgi:AcrR family transcriptional regulator
MIFSEETWAAMHAEPILEKPKSRLSPEERLIAAGQRLFCREGIHATGIARLLAEAGVSRKTLYERFGSKERLLHVVLEREGATWRHWFARGLEATSGTPSERLLAAFDLLDEWFQQPNFYGCAFINAVAEHDKLSMPLSELAITHRAETNRLLLDIAGQTGASEPELLVEKLSVLIDGAIVTAMITRQPEAAKHAKQAAADILRANCGLDRDSS